MIHTVEIYALLSRKEGREIEKKYRLDKGEDRIDITRDVTDRYGVRVELRKVMTRVGVGWETNIFIDFIKFLDKNEITIGDRNEIIDGVNALSIGVFGYKKEFQLRRIDYRFDVIIEDRSLRNLFIKLFKKCQDNVSYMKKEKNKAYKTSARFKNKGKACNIYDKEAEREDKGFYVMPYEKNVLRFEAQVKSNNLKYMKSKYSVNPTLEVYFTKKMFAKFMKDLVLKPIGTGDYYSAGGVKNKLKGKMKEIEIEQLVDFLNFVSIKRSMSKAKLVYGNYKYKKFIRILDENGINPVVIPKNDSIAKLNNPLNGLIEIVNIATM